MEKLSQYFQREFNTNETMYVLQNDMVIYWSWGVSGRLNLDNKALVFKVHGNHHSGYVLIVLAWNDTYTVHYLNRQLELLSTSSEIYFDMLVETIDTKIERTGDYRY